MEKELKYETPMVEIIEVKVEKGFANSGENWYETPGQEQNNLQLFDLVK